MKATQEKAQEQKIRPEILEDFGPWMLATRAKRRPRQQGSQKTNSQEKKREEPGEQGSRFSVLDGAEEMDADEDAGKATNEQGRLQSNLEATNSASLPERKSTEKIRKETSEVSNVKESKGKKELTTREGNKEKMEKAGTPTPPHSSRTGNTPKQAKSSGDYAAKDTPKSALGTKLSKEAKQAPQHKQGKPKSGVTTHLTGSPGCGNDKGQASGARAGHQPKMKAVAPCNDSKEKAKKKDCIRKTSAGTSPGPTVKQISWKPPREGWTQVQTDGSVYTSTGVAAAGGLLRDHLGGCSKAFVCNLGRCSLTSAELKAAAIRLKIAWEEGHRKVELNLDSKTAISIILGSEDDDHRHGLLAASIRVLLNLDWEVKISHVFREMNVAADYLANVGHRFTFAPLFRLQGRRPMAPFE
ncbi:unnamed protein product [Linum tenue]|uniref:RNase H type-1 domain-containing protein n=1 Tax=Linum tenue TaxID=586396 RepID=A0AAV0GV84_9ROSI|nr:unnamed protein product [Linum tenue]